MEPEKTTEDSLLYKKVKHLLIHFNKKYKDLVKAVEMSPHGLRLSLKRNKASLDTLKRIARFFNIKHRYFADDVSIHSVEEMTLDEEQDMAEDAQGGKIPSEAGRRYIDSRRPRRIGDVEYHALALKKLFYYELVQYYASKYPEDDVTKLLFKHMNIPKIQSARLSRYTGTITELIDEFKL